MLAPCQQVGFVRTIDCVSAAFNVSDACRTLKRARCFVAGRTVDGAHLRGVGFSKSKETKTNEVQTLNARKFVLRLLSVLPAWLQVVSSVISSIADCT